MKIIFLSGWFPYPADNGSKIRIFNLLRSLASRHQVTFVTFYRSPEEVKNLPALETICDKVFAVPWKEFQTGSTKSILGFFSIKPRSLVDIYSTQMKRFIEIQIQHPYDALICSQTYMADYVPRSLTMPALWEEIELGWSYEAMRHSKSLLSRIRTRLAWQKNIRYIRSRSQLFKVCTVVSEKERFYLQKACPAHPLVEIIPNCIDVNSYLGIHANPEPNSLIFSGSISYSANYDAMDYFTRDILPLIEHSEPDVSLTVTGNTQGITIPTKFRRANIRFTGYVTDIKTTISKHTVSIVPILSGGGTRLKILEAFALGVPVVSTSKGAEGLEAVSEKHLLIADEPGDFAKAVIAILRDPMLRQTLIDHARQLVMEKYNWSLVSEHFLQLVETL
jgi:glycosyltransferase involved in cell wall biosynthesis